jgi:hypothetical protein
MMMLPNPGVLDHLIRDRQEQLRETECQAMAPRRAGLRIRIGHALIVAGLNLSGERAELPARSHALSRSA